ncbi:hypothetical protein I3842_16G093900 [Carya illinoinensis]|uniref:Uncharacterized protein n=1 Tax=Carya illinoinensis TaxID=32201 RepID=A0A922A385_CARIL|nr:hypothetical protein I3842_16G093900 [Carya illinoinensis]
MRLTLWFLLGGLCVFLLFHASYCRIMIETNELSRLQGQQYRYRPWKKFGREFDDDFSEAQSPPIGAKARNP